MNGNRKLILELIWRLIQHYSDFGDVMKAPEACLESALSDSQIKKVRPLRKQESQSLKRRLLNWLQNKIPTMGITNCTTDWNDGRGLCELINAFAPGIYIFLIVTIYAEYLHRGPIVYFLFEILYSVFMDVVTKF